MTYESWFRKWWYHDRFLNTRHRLICKSHMKLPCGAARVCLVGTRRSGAGPPGPDLAAQGRKSEGEKSLFYCTNGLFLEENVDFIVCFWHRHLQIIGLRGSEKCKWQFYNAKRWFLEKCVTGKTFSHYFFLKNWAKVMVFRVQNSLQPMGVDFCLISGFGKKPETAERVVLFRSSRTLKKRNVKKRFWKVIVLRR